LFWLIYWKTGVPGRNFKDVISYWGAAELFLMQSVPQAQKS